MIVVALAYAICKNVLCVLLCGECVVVVVVAAVLVSSPFVQLVACQPASTFTPTTATITSNNTSNNSNIKIRSRTASQQPSLARHPPPRRTRFTIRTATSL